MPHLYNKRAAAARDLLLLRITHLALAMSGSLVYIMNYDFYRSNGTNIWKTNGPVAGGQKRH